MRRKISAHVDGGQSVSVAWVLVPSSVLCDLKYEYTGLFRMNEKFPLTPMEVLAHRLRMIDRSLFPLSAWAVILWCTCIQSQLQTSPPTPQKSYPKFRNPRTTFEISKVIHFCHSNKNLCPPNYSIVWGVGGIPFFVLLESFYFSDLGAHAKIWNPTTTPSVVLNIGGKKRN